MMDWFLSNWAELLQAASNVVFGASVAVLAVSKLTKTDKDDKAAAWLQKVLSLLNKLALNPKQ